MVLLDLDSNSVLTHCSCVNDLDYQKRLDSLEEIFRNKQDLPKSIGKLLIYCYTDYCKIGLNSVGLTLKRGLNVTCLCALQSKGVTLHLTEYFLSKLERIPTKVENGVAFVVKPWGHKANCTNYPVPSLYETTYANLYLNGLTSNKLRTLVKQGNIPITIFTNRPVSYIHIPYFHLPALRSFYTPLITRFTVGCSDPMKHLETSINEVVI
jgi:hypothetical protein